MAGAVLDGWRSVAEAATAWGSTWNTCHRAVAAMADSWVDRFDTGMVAISGDQGLLAQVNGRHVTTVVDWINAQTPAFRAGITDVATDMSAAQCRRRQHGPIGGHQGRLTTM